MDHDVIYELYDILLSFLDALVWCYKWREKMEGKKFCHLFHSILVLLYTTFSDTSKVETHKDATELCLLVTLFPTCVLSFLIVMSSESGTV